MKYVVRVIYLSSYVLDLVGRGALVAMVPLVIAAVCLRGLRISSIGIFEVVVLLGTVAFTFSWAYTETTKDHIRVQMVMSRLPKRVQSIIDSITYFLSVAACFVMTKYSFSFAAELSREGQVISSVFPMPASIIMYAIAVMFIVLGLVLLTHLIGLICSLSGGKKE